VRVGSGMGSAKLVQTRTKGYPISPDLNSLKLPKTSRLAEIVLMVAGELGGLRQRDAIAGNKRKHDLRSKLREVGCVCFGRRRGKKGHISTI
jgi:hypothetical protein